MATSSGCLRVRNEGGLYLFEDAKVDDPLFGPLGTPGTIATLGEVELKQRYEDVLRLKSPLALLDSPEEALRIFGHPELISAAVHIHAGRLAVEEGGVVTAFSDMREPLTEEEIAKGLAVNWILDPDHYRMRQQWDAAATAANVQ